jgi:hypothetical protein
LRQRFYKHFGGLSKKKNKKSATDVRGFMAAKGLRWPTTASVPGKYDAFAQIEREGAHLGAVFGSTQEKQH